MVGSRVSVVDHRGGAIHGLWSVDRCGVIHWLHWTIDSRGGGVAIDSSVDWSSSYIVASCDMNWSISLGISVHST